jgi:succinoglycan biosynthesis protein ExoM
MQHRLTKSGRLLGEGSPDVRTFVDAVECVALSRADAIVAADERAGEFLRTRIPQTKIIVAPTPVCLVGAPQPGSGGKVLFVGGATAANADGVLWFLNECWPQIRDQRGDTTFYIGGSICKTLQFRAEGVQLLSSASDLESLYMNAGVVIAPQRVSLSPAGLLNVLARGKAAVVTSKGLQELGDPFESAVRVENEPAAFASAVIELLDAKNAREMIGGHALLLLKERFSAAASFVEFFELSEHDAAADSPKVTICQTPYGAGQELLTQDSDKKKQSLPRAERVSVVVCICTFRRPNVLTAIESVDSQVLPDYVDLRIVVIDNDSIPAAEKHIKDFSTKIDTPVEYIHAPGQNISIARNAGLDAAATSDWLAFLDDDEFASYCWIYNLLEARDCANAIFGPCKALYSEGAPFWIRAGDYHSCLSDGSDSKPLTSGHTSNVLVDMKFVRENGLRFEVALGNVGGEDSLFFHTMYRRGAKLKFSSAAMVFEEVAASRLNLSWIAKRKYRAGQTHAITVQRFDPNNYWRLPWVAVCKVAFCGVVSVLNVFRPARLMWWLMRGTYHLGVLRFCLGAELHQEYQGGADR